MRESSILLFLIDWSSWLHKVGSWGVSWQRGSLVLHWSMGFPKSTAFKNSASIMDFHARASDGSIGHRKGDCQVSFSGKVMQFIVLELSSIRQLPFGSLAVSISGIFLKDTLIREVFGGNSRLMGMAGKRYQSYFWGRWLFGRESCAFAILFMRFLIELRILLFVRRRRRKIFGVYVYVICKYGHQEAMKGGDLNWDFGSKIPEVRNRHAR